MRHYNVVATSVAKWIKRAMNHRSKAKYLLPLSSCSSSCMHSKCTDSNTSPNEQQQQRKPEGRTQMTMLDILTIIADSFRLLPRTTTKLTPADWLVRLTVLAAHNSKKKQWIRRESSREAHSPSHRTSPAPFSTPSLPPPCIHDLVYLVRVCDASYANSTKQFMKESRLEHSEVTIVREHAGGIFAPKYVLYLDHTRRFIVLVVRGTASLGDFCTDMCMHHEAFASGYGMISIIIIIDKWQ
jgi:hypothetical protein